MDNRLISLINTHLPPRISIPTVLHIVVLSGVQYISSQDYWVSISGTLNGALPVTTIATMAMSLYLVLLASYVFLCMKMRKNFRPRFGLLWDKDKEPYCPIHEKPLTRHKVQINGKIEAGLHCIKCNKSIPPITDTGARLTLSEAKALL